MLKSRLVRAFVALVVSLAVVAVVAQGFMSERFSPLANVFLAPVVILVALVPAPNIGSAERPVYEGTPAHVLAALVGYLVSIAVYAFAAYRVLSAYNRRP